MNTPEQIKSHALADAAKTTHAHERNARAIAIAHAILAQHGSAYHCADTDTMRARVIEAAAKAVAPLLIDDSDVIETYAGKDGHRYWGNCGVWLYPGDRVVLIPAAKSSAPLPHPILSGELILAGTFPVRDEEVTGVVIRMTEAELRAVNTLPLYKRVNIFEA